MGQIVLITHEDGTALSMIPARSALLNGTLPFFVSSTAIGLSLTVGRYARQSLRRPICAMNEQTGTRWSFLTPCCMQQRCNSVASQEKIVSLWSSMQSKKEAQVYQTSQFQGVWHTWHLPWQSKHLRILAHECTVPGLQCQMILDFIQSWHRFCIYNIICNQAAAYKWHFLRIYFSFHIAHLPYVGFVPLNDCLGNIREELKIQKLPAKVPGVNSNCF